MTAARPLPSDTSLRLDAVMRQASLALNDIGQIVAQLEGQLLQDIAHLRADSHTLATLQSVDLLTQSVAEMEHLMERLEGAVPPDAHVAAGEVIGPIKLAHLRAVFLAEETSAQRASEDQDKGGVALF